MAEEITACIEQIEKGQQELGEILVRDHEEHREKMAQMMHIIRGRHSIFLLIRLLNRNFILHVFKNKKLNQIVLKPKIFNRI